MQLQLQALTALPEITNNKSSHTSDWPFSYVKIIFYDPSEQFLSC